MTGVYASVRANGAARRYHSRPHELATIVLLVAGCASAPPPVPPLCRPCPACEPAVVQPTTKAPVEPTAEPTVEPTAEPTAEPAAEPTAEPVPPAPTALPGGLGYRGLWSKKPNGWSTASVIIPSGDLANSSGSTLTIHARHDGRELESKEICAAAGPRAMTVLRGKLYVACSDTVIEVSLPGLEHRVVLRDILTKSGSLFREAAFGGDRVAYTHNDGSMEVYSTTTWSLLTSRKLAKHTFSQHIAVSGSGAWIALGDEDAQAVQVFEGTRQSTLKGLRAVFAFSPNGSRVFGSSGSFQAGDMAISGGAVRDVMRTGSWLTAAVYLGNDRLAVAGSDGIVVKDLHSGQLQQLVRMTAETLAVSSDGRLVCGADRGNEIACFGQGTIGSAPGAGRRP
jgi:hypothetical protein